MSPRQVEIADQIGAVCLTFDKLIRDLERLMRRLERLETRISGVYAEGYADGVREAMERRPR